jgi:hypothetical protein
MSDPLLIYLFINAAIVGLLTRIVRRLRLRIEYLERKAIRSPQS